MSNSPNPFSWDRALWRGTLVRSGISTSSAGPELTVTRMVPLLLTRLFAPGSWSRMVPAGFSLHRLPGLLQGKFPSSS